MSASNLVRLGWRFVPGLRDGMLPATTATTPPGARWSWITCPPARWSAPCTNASATRRSLAFLRTVNSGPSHCPVSGDGHTGPGRGRRPVGRFGGTARSPQPGRGLPGPRGPIEARNGPAPDLGARGPRPLLDGPRRRHRSLGGLRDRYRRREIRPVPAGPGRTPTLACSAGVGPLTVTPPVSRQRHLSEMTNIVAFPLARAN